MNNNAKEIVYISVDSLVPHRNNPRKDIGDVTELSDSIKAKGILQNLTVVPFEGVGDRYTVIIGHRRLAAAKQAGLKSVPCVIADMDEKEQIETMLLENIQRSDLTVYEEAEGFQLMFDLGETVASVAEKTGFSQSTIRRRAKLLELDKRKFKESVDRGATLDDYMKLDKLESTELKNKVLEFIGTSNFDWKLREAIREEEIIKTKTKIIEKLSTFAEPLTGMDDDLFFYERYWNDEIEIPEDANEVKYYYIEKSGYVELYCESTEDDDSAEDVIEQERGRELSERRQKLDEIKKIAFELRQNFINNIGASQILKYKELILKISVYAELHGKSLWNYKGILKRFTRDTNECAESDGKKEMWEFCEKNPGKAALILAWEKIDEEYAAAAHNWDCEYINNNKLLVLYDYLLQLGYEMSDDEAYYVYGAHELYIKPEEKVTQNDE